MELGNRLCYEITFNDYNRVINSSVATRDAEYEISNISLEYEIVTQPTLAKHISDKYQHMALLYDRVVRHRHIKVNKLDTTWNWSFNMPCKSLKGILVLFEKEKSYVRDTSKFYNPKIEKVSVIVEGKPNQLYAQGMRSFAQYDEARKYFAEGKLQDNDANEVQAQLQLHDLSVGEYLTNKYALWLDFRMIDETWDEQKDRKCIRRNHPTDREETKNIWGSQCLHLPHHGCSVEHPKWRICFYIVLDQKCL